jgi:hypothetical protein
VSWIFGSSPSTVLVLHGVSLSWVSGSSSPEELEELVPLEFTGSSLVSLVSWWSAVSCKEINMQLEYQFRKENFVIKTASLLTWNLGDVKSVMAENKINKQKDTSNIFSHNLCMQSEAQLQPVQ